MPYAKDFPTAKDNHEYQQLEDGRYQCQVCNHTVKRIAGGVCVGIPIIYQWDDVPDSMGTKTKLSKELGLKVGKNQLPVAAKYRYDRKGNFAGYYPLYSTDEATPKAKPTEAQLKALEKARYMAEKITIKCSQCDSEIESRYHYLTVTRKQYKSNKEHYDSCLCDFCTAEYEAIQWAKSILQNDDVVILDSETTSLRGEIIELAIIDIQGNVLFNQRIKPKGTISPSALQVHGITLDDLQNEPIFPEIYDDLKSILEGKHVVIYNLNFDWSHLCHAFITYDLPAIEPKGSDCAMEWYAQFYGELYNDNEYKWQPLDGGNHTALGDCQATLALIQRMADYERD